MKRIGENQKMDIEKYNSYGKLSKDEEKILYKAVDEYEKYGIIKQTCPRCNGKLIYNGNKATTSYRIFCENESKCGTWLGIRGL